MTARADQNGPSGQFPPDAGRVTLLIIGGMVACWAKWPCAWLLVTLAGGWG